VKVATVVEHMNRMDIEQKFIQKDITQVAHKLEEAIGVLKEASTEINSVKASQITLEVKVDENTATTKREMQKLHETVQSYASDCRETTLYLQRRLDAHEALPSDQAHPNSAA
jgi:predicted  nucleic acid-binding Zn-ribbon protein